VVLESNVNGKPSLLKLVGESLKVEKLGKHKPEKEE
jgi:hypothetical protein